MKKILYIAVVTAATLFQSCSSNFLEKDPPLEMSQSDVFSTKARVESTLLGVYSQFKNDNFNSFMGGKTYIAFDALGEDFVNIGANLVTLYGAYNMQTDINDAENIITWQEAYLAINNANVFLAGLDGAKSVAGDSYGQFKSEALFVRALSYYYLASLYGLPYKLNSGTSPCVPLRLTAATDATGNNLKRSTVAEVYNQILTDLNDANIANLASNTDATRATVAAAHALRMRVYMEMENWSAAITEGNKILSDSNYSLTTNLGDNYNSTNTTSESIFVLPMADNNRPGTQQTPFEYYNDGQTMIIDKQYGVYSIAGYHNAADQRVASLMSTVGGHLICSKYPNKNIWIPIMRLAEINLAVAECYANVGDPTSLTSAKALLKAVRRRSLADSSDTDFSNAKIDALSKTNLLTAIYNEKRLEFLGEGQRALDIHRRAESYVKPSAGINVATSATNYIWPIPSSETTINKGL